VAVEEYAKLTLHDPFEALILYIDNDSVQYCFTLSTDR